MIFGFVLAAGCLIGLWTLGYRQRFRGGMHFGLSRVFRRLQTTPGQEQVIRTAFLRLKSTGKNVVEQVRDARPAFSALLEEDQFDEQRARDWIGARTRSIEDAAPEIVDAVREIHKVLDPEQRAELARLSTSRFSGWGRFHHHHERPGPC